MEDFIRDAATARWWISVVVVGITLNILSAYLKAGFEGVARYSIDKWRVRGEENQKARLEILVRINSDIEFRSFLRHKELSMRLRAMLTFIAIFVTVAISSVSFTPGSWPWFVICGFSALFILGVTSDLGTAFNISRDLTKAESERQGSKSSLQDQRA